MSEERIEKLYKLQRHPSLPDAVQLACNCIPWLKGGGCDSLIHVGCGDGTVVDFAGQVGLRSCGTEVATVMLESCLDRDLEVYPYTDDRVVDKLADHGIHAALAFHLEGSARCFDKELAKVLLGVATKCALVVSDQCDLSEEVLREVAPEGAEFKRRQYGYRSLQAIFCWI